MALVARHAACSWRAPATAVGRRLRPAWRAATASSRRAATTTASTTGSGRDPTTGRSRSSWSDPAARGARQRRQRCPATTRRRGRGHFAALPDARPGPGRFTDPGQAAPITRRLRPDGRAGSSRHGSGSHRALSDPQTTWCSQRTGAPSPACRKVSSSSSHGLPSSLSISTSSVVSPERGLDHRGLEPVLGDHDVAVQPGDGVEDAEVGGVGVAGALGGRASAPR